MKPIFTVKNNVDTINSTHEDQALTTDKSLMDLLMSRILFPVIPGKKKIILIHAMPCIL